MHPAAGLTGKMDLVARLIKQGFGTRVFYVALDGFDTHADQADDARRPAARSRRRRSATSSTTLKEGKHDERVVLMTFSEFGRRVKENGSRGTDHGAGSCLFVAGPAVKGGPVGEHPKLDDLDGGDLKHPRLPPRLRHAARRLARLRQRAVLGGKFEHCRCSRRSNRHDRAICSLSRSWPWRTVAPAVRSRRSGYCSPATQVYVRWDGVAAHRDAYAQVTVGKLFSDELAPLVKSLKELYARALQSGLVDEKLLTGSAPTCWRRFRPKSSRRPGRSTSWFPAAWSSALRSAPFRACCRWRWEPRRAYCRSNRARAATRSFHESGRPSSSPAECGMRRLYST